jgi:hypothetical protein
MMSSKYNVSDKVKINSRAPSWCELDRTRKRTIVSIEYCPELQATLYILGSNGKGSNRDGNPVDGYGSYAFRSYQLDQWNHTGKRGRPRQKRRYHHSIHYWAGKIAAEREQADAEVMAVSDTAKNQGAGIFTITL